jgi:hypothetical protein
MLIPEKDFTPEDWEVTRATLEIGDILNDLDSHVALRVLANLLVGTYRNSEDSAHAIAHLLEQVSLFLATGNQSN